MLRLSRMLQTRNKIDLKTAKLRDLQGAYIADFYDTWHEKAQNIREANRRQSDRPILNSNNNFLGTRFNNN